MFGQLTSPVMYLVGLIGLSARMSEPTRQTCCQRPCTGWYSPVYQQTVCEELERQRTKLGVVLLCHLVIAAVDVMAGRIVACSLTVGLVVVGNSARCTLESFTLLVYSVFEYTTGALGLIWLLHEFVHVDASVLLAPFKLTLWQNILMFIPHAYPLVHLCGGLIAWRICSLMPFAASPDSMGTSFVATSRADYGTSSVSPHTTANTYDTTEGRRSSATLVLHGPVQAPLDGVSAVPGPAEHVIRDWCRRAGMVCGEFHPAPSLLDDSDLSVSSQDRDNENQTVCCAECAADTIPDDGARCGTGRYSSSVYCSQCWDNWMREV